MTNISNLAGSSNQTRLWAEANQVGINSPEQLTLTEIDPSTMVTLRNGKTSSDYLCYQVLEQRIASNPFQKWAQPYTDRTSNLMARNFNGLSNANRFLGLGGELLANVEHTTADYTQSVAEVSSHIAQGATARPSGNIYFSIETRSGAKVELKLSNQGDRLAAEIKTKGELSTAEQTAISQLSDSFETAMQGLLAEPPRADIAALTQFDSNQLSAVELKATMEDKDGISMEFELRADSRQREFKLQNRLGSMAVKVDLQQAGLLGNAEQREKAISQYLKQIDQASERGKPNATMQALFKDTFYGLHKTAPSDTIHALKTSSKASELNDLAHSVLTGLGDFEADLTMKPTAPNPRKTLELDHFSFQLKQKSSLINKVSLTQQQESNLSASYHESLIPGLPLRLDATKESQNYVFKTIQDHATSKVNVRYDGDQQISAAQLEKTAQQSTQIQRYEMAKLTQDLRIPEQAHFIQDLLSAMKSLQKRSNDSTENELQRQQKLGELNQMIMLDTNPASVAKTQALQPLRRNLQQTM